MISRNPATHKLDRVWRRTSPVSQVISLAKRDEAFARSAFIALGEHLRSNNQLNSILKEVMHDRTDSTDR